MVYAYYPLRGFSAYRIMDFSLASETSIQLFTELKVKTEEKTTELAVPCMKAALSLILYTTQKLHDYPSDDESAGYQSRLSVERNVFADLQQKLSEWISAVLGSGEIKVKKPKPEIKVSEYTFQESTPIWFLCPHSMV